MTFKAGQKVRILPGNGWFKDDSKGVIDNPIVNSGGSLKVTGELKDNSFNMSLWIRKDYLSPLKTYKIIL